MVLKVYKAAPNTVLDVSHIGPLDHGLHIRLPNKWGTGRTVAQFKTSRGVYQRFTIVKG